MASGYKINWTPHALKELEKTYEYLELNFTPNELRKLSSDLNKSLQLISKNPKLFPQSASHGIRRIVIKKFNTLYYREKLNSIEVISFYSNRKNPSNLKL